MDTTKKIAVMLGLCLMTSISFAGATFHPGDKGNQITTIQQALANYGYNISVDGDYGASTQAAVRQFQEAQGLEADGIVGAATYEALMGEAMPENHTVQAGASAAMPAATSQNEITLVQQALANNGYDVAVDGAFGPGTERAIRSYQVDHGLEPDGIVGQETFYSLTGQSLPTGPIRRFGSGGYNGVSRVESPEATHILDIANQYIGVPYVFGGSTPSGFDCSGFTRYVYSAAGIDLPRGADEQYGVGYSVSMANLQPGDLVFFSTYESGISHVGIYIGNHQFINAASDGVSISDMDSNYWSARYIGAKRVM